MKLFTIDRGQIPESARTILFWCAVFCKEPDKDGYDFDVDEILSILYSNADILERKK